MPLQYIINGDKTKEAFNKINSNTQEQFTNVQYDNGNLIVTRNNGTTITVALPISEEGGKVLSSVGSITLGSTSGAYNKVTITPIVYIFEGVKYDISTNTFLSLANGDATLDRLDAIYINTGTNTIQVQQGTPNSNPTLPTLTDDKILIGVVLVRAGASPTVLNSYQIIYSVYPSQQVAQQINNGVPKNNLYELNDVSLSAATAGDSDILTYSTSLGKWFPAQISYFLQANTAGSGLTSIGNKIELGGILTHDTNIDLNNKWYRVSRGSNAVVDYSNYLLKNNNKTSIDWANRQLHDATNKVSINYSGRTLKDANEITSLDWRNRNFYSTAGVLIAGWNNNDTLKAYYIPDEPQDLTPKSYVDGLVGSSTNVFNNGLTKTNSTVGLGGTLLKNTDININSKTFRVVNGAQTIASFGAFTLYDSNQILSHDWSGRSFFASSSGAIKSIDYNNYLLKHKTGPNRTSLDWDKLITYDDSSNPSINWGNRILINSLGNSVLSWNNLELSDNTGNISVAWNDRVLINSSGNSSINWNTGLLYDLTTSNTSINWEAKLMFDNSGFQSIDWHNRQLNDINGNSVVNWSGSTSGLIYNSDFSNDYTNRSLVDKDYVDNNVNATNGLTKVGKSVKLGGAISEHTYLTMDTDDTHQFVIGDYSGNRASFFEAYCRADVWLESLGAGSSGALGRIILDNAGVSINTNKTLGGFGVYGASLRTDDLTDRREFQFPDVGGAINASITIDIGDWNFSTTTDITIAHGLGSDWQKVRGVDVIVRNDSDDKHFIFYKKFNASSSGSPTGDIEYFDATDIKLTKEGSFNPTPFSATSYNRGWITFRF